MTTKQKVEELAKLDQSNLSDFEKRFVSDNAARIAKWGDDTHFSDKQAALVDRIYKERIEEGRVPGGGQE